MPVRCRALIPYCQTCDLEHLSYRWHLCSYLSLPVYIPNRVFKIHNENLFAGFWYAAPAVVFQIQKSYFLYSKEKKKKSINSPGNLGSHPLHHLSSSSSQEIQILISANGLSTCKPSSLSCPEQSVFDKALEKALRCNWGQWDINIYLSVFLICLAKI